jgi:hypothetical protein
MKPKSILTAYLHHIDGTTLPGGCELCDAEITTSEVTTDVWSLTVHHDDWCPEWRAMHARSN